MSAGLATALGMVQTGPMPGTAMQAVALVAVAGWMLFAVAVNDLAEPRSQAHLLRYDSVRGRLNAEVVVEDPGP